MSEAADTPRRAGRRRPWGLAFVFHPLLLAAYPVLYLFNQNIREQVTMAALFEPLLLVLAVTFGVFVLAFALFRDLVRAALATSLLVALVFSFGHVSAALKDVLASPGQLLAVWAVVACGGIVLIARLPRRATRAATGALNLVAAVLIGFNLVSIVGYQVQELGRSPRPAASNAATGASNTAGTTRDIYYLILDRYTSAEVLEEQYGFDNSEFLDELRRRGFYVASESRANYLKSAFTISSTLNMDYHDGASLAEQASAPNDFGPLYRMLRDALAVQRFLKSQGYSYIHMGSWWQGTATNSAADLNLRYSNLSEFSSVLYDSTVLPALEPETADEAVPEQLPFRQRHREHTVYQFERLPLVAEIRGPKFVLAHIAVPHSPYVFDRNGGYVTEQMERSRSREFNYQEHVRYANRETLQLLDVLLAGPPETDPIIVLQGDEGTFPLRYATDTANFPWAEATVEELEEKFGIFNSYYLPGVDPEEAGLYESITPVNSFRVVFNTYFDADLPLLPDRQFVFHSESRLYELTDATPRLTDAE